MRLEYFFFTRKSVFRHSNKNIHHSKINTFHCNIYKDQRHLLGIIYNIKYLKKSLLISELAIN
jgi:hypothetical protein